MEPHYTTSIPNKRFCSRCLGNLNDSISLTIGVGPECRSQTNTLYSRHFNSSSLSSAIALLLTLEKEELCEETQEKFQKVKYNLFHISEKVAQSGNPFDPTEKGFDITEVLETFEWILSFSKNVKFRPIITKVIFHLGYVGLAGILLQQASIEPAKIWFENGCLQLIGNYSRFGNMAFKQYEGCIGPRKQGDKVWYSVPSGMFQVFKIITMIYWPFYTGDMHRLEIVSRAYTEAQKRMSGMLPAVITTDGKLVQPTGVISAEDLISMVETTGLDYSIPPMSPSGTFLAQTIVTSNKEDDPDMKPYATFKLRSKDFTVNLPWIKNENARMFAIISNIKSRIPKEDREYNHESKIWTIKLEHKEIVKEILKEHYELREIDTKEETPIKNSVKPPPPSSGSYSINFNKATKHKANQNK